MAVDNLTINEALIHLKTLRARHAELVGLRNQNSYVETRHYGLGGDKEVKRDPIYDVKALDRNVNGVAQEIRKIEMAIKQANAVTPIGVPLNDAVLAAIE